MAESNEFKDINPYEVLGVPETASEEEIRKAYRRQALRWHPDKVSPSEHDEAHTTFQRIAFSYSILSDKRRRDRYDRTGQTDELLDDDDFNWGDYFDTAYKDAISEASIAAFRAEYKGSEEERGDVLKAYERFRGDMDRVFETVMLSDVLEDGGRFGDVIREGIKEGKVKEYKAFTQESEKKRERRRKRAEREAREAKRRGDGEKKEAGKKRTARDEKSRGSKEDKKEESPSDLLSLISSRQQQRKSKGAAFLEQLEEKYVKKSSSRGGKRKNNLSDHPSEEAFAEMRKRRRE
ncbi:hypothetical protein KEM55_005885 [Ascosphaera atra]|nr:hypothetical protein KEM55_005885 [Ascosphaera atra]